MKRRIRANKKFGKRGSKKVYKKRNFMRLQKTMSKKQTRRCGPRKIRGGIPPFYAEESYIEEDPEDYHNLETTLSLDETMDEEGQTDSEGESRNANSFSNVATELPGNPFNGSTISNISAISNNNNTSAGTMSVGELDLNNASTSGNTTFSSVSRGGRREKGKKTQKRRMGKKGGELPFDYNPNDVDKDVVHD